VDTALAKKDILLAQCNGLLGESVTQLQSRAFKQQVKFSSKCCSLDEFKRFHKIIDVGKFNGGFIFTADVNDFASILDLQADFSVVTGEVPRANAFGYFNALDFTSVAVTHGTKVQWCKCQTVFFSGDELNLFVQFIDQLVAAHLNRGNLCWAL